MPDGADPAWSSRLREVFGVSLHEVRREHIESLVATHVSENADLDFKATLYGNTDNDKRELCKDIAAMRNSRGGVIVLGVGDKDALAHGCPEVRLSDAEERRMHLTVASGTAPHAAFDILRVQGQSKTKGFYLLVAAPSPFRPHAVVVGDAFRYPRRDGSTTRYLSEVEVADLYRDRFRGEHQQLDRLNDIATELLATVAKGDTPWLVAALVPNNPGAMRISFAGLAEIEQWARSEHTSNDRIDGFYDGTVPTAGVGVDRYTLGTVRDEGKRPDYVYAECHTDGAASAGVVFYRHNDEKDTTTVFTTDLVWRATRALRLIGRHAVHNAGAYGDATVELRIVGRNMSLGYYRDGRPQQHHSGFMIHEARSRHTLPLESIAGDPQQVFAAVKVMLTQIFNGFGRAEVGHIAEDGTLRLPYFKDPGLGVWAEARGVATSEEQVPG